MLISYHPAIAIGKIDASEGSSVLEFQKTGRQRTEGGSSMDMGPPERKVVCVERLKRSSDPGILAQQPTLPEPLRLHTRESLCVTLRYRGVS